MYLDSAYIAKYYVNEGDAMAVRELIRRAVQTCSSALALVEVTSVFHRHVREGSLTAAQGHRLMDAFTSHADADLWNLIPVTSSLLDMTTKLYRKLSSKVPLRASDAIHLATALSAGETEIWTNDRRLLTAAESFGLQGKSVSPAD